MRSVEECMVLTKADTHMDVRWRPHEGRYPYGCLNGDLFKRSPLRQPYGCLKKTDIHMDVCACRSLRRCPELFVGLPKTHEGSSGFVDVQNFFQSLPTNTVRGGFTNTVLWFPTHVSLFVAARTQFVASRTMFVVVSRTHFVASTNTVRGGFTNTVLWLPTHVSLFVAARTQFVASRTMFVVASRTHFVVSTNMVRGFTRSVDRVGAHVPLPSWSPSSAECIVAPCIRVFVGLGMCDIHTVCMRGVHCVCATTISPTPTHMCDACVTCTCVTCGCTAEDPKRVVISRWWWWGVCACAHDTHHIAHDCVREQER